MTGFSVKESSSPRSSFSTQVRMLARSPGAACDQGREEDVADPNGYEHAFGADSISWKERDGWTSRRKKVAAVIESRRFELGMAALILCNMLLVALETNYQADTGKTPLVLDLLAVAIIFIYTADIAIRITVYGSHFFRSSWNVFDMVVVAVDAISEALYMYNFDLGANMSILKIMRLGRLLRSLELIRIFEELHAMLGLIMSAWRAMFWGIVLMMICLTLFAIVAVQVLHPLNQEIAEETNYYDDCYRCGRAFSSVEHSILTFFQQIIAGDSWGQVSVVLIEHHPWTFTILISLVFLVNLGLTNLVVTVMIDRAQTCHEENMKTVVAEKERNVQALQRKFNRLCRTLDTDESGQLTLEEMERGMSDVPEFSDILKLFDIRREDLPLVFEVMDRDRSGQVSYDEFVWQMYMMKTDVNTHSVMLITKAYANELRNQIQAQMRALQSELRDQFRVDVGHLGVVTEETTRCDSRQALRDGLDLRVAMQGAVEATKALQASVDEFLAGTADSLVGELADRPWSVDGAGAHPVHPSKDEMPEARGPVIGERRGLPPASFATVQWRAANGSLFPGGDEAQGETHTAWRRTVGDLARRQCIV